jgi:glyoxalase family protein
MPGIHHVTAIAGNAARNVAFYARTLGLRMIKTTVNFDDPSTYHLYFGDEQGQPGTVLTFFPHEHAAPGRAGVGQAVETAFSIPEASLGWWTQRFIAQGVAHSAPETRFGETLLPFKDQDGTHLALIATPAVNGLPGHAAQDVPAEHAIRGFHGVTLWVADHGPSAAVLTEALGFAEGGLAEEAGGTRRRYAAPGATLGGVVDLKVVGGFLPGRMGAGSVHHVAFRAGSDAEQDAMARTLSSTLGISATEQVDRTYFRSIYFREPSGVIFEIATDDPGFTVDETVETLGQKLMLPPWLENRREAVVAALPKLDMAPAA